MHYCAWLLPKTVQHISYCLNSIFCYLPVNRPEGKLNYRLFLQTLMHEVSTPQTDYRPSGYKFNDIILKSKAVFAGLRKNAIINKIFDKN